MTVHYTLDFLKFFCWKIELVICFSNLSITFVCLRSVNFTKYLTLTPFPRPNSAVDTVVVGDSRGDGRTMVKEMKVQRKKRKMAKRKEKAKVLRVHQKQLWREQIQLRQPLKTNQQKSLPKPALRRNGFNNEHIMFRLLLSLNFILNPYRR